MAKKLLYVESDYLKMQRDKKFIAALMSGCEVIYATSIRDVLQAFEDHDDLGAVCLGSEVFGESPRGLVERLRARKYKVPVYSMGTSKLGNKARRLFHRISDLRFDYEMLQKIRKNLN
ncbi:hypothetical protein KY330_04610 [Candidatus Woesearchaeota archaeon]|nr:hypothetical protein [Candidatus Woesearchaeota archaeon]